MSITFNLYRNANQNNALMGAHPTGNAPADPGVASVSGTIADGQTITISGSGFGNSGPANYMFENYEDGTEGSQILATNTNFDIDTSATAKGLRDTDSRSGTYAASVFQDNGGSWVATNLSVDLGGRFTEAFASFAVKIPAGYNFPGNDGGNAGTNSDYSSDSSMKLGWFLGDGDPPNFYESSDDDLVSLTHVGGGTWHTAGNDLGVIHNHGNSPTWWKWGNWHRISMGATGGADLKVDAGDYYFQVANTVDPIHEIKTNPVVFASARPENAVGWVKYNFIGWLRDRADQGNVKVLVDDCYLAWGANKYARVELGNNAVYENCTDLSICEAGDVNWSDGSITATVREGGLDLTQDIWLFITLPDNLTRYSFQVVTT